MAVYYKFKSAKDFDSIAIDGHFISVATLKEKIFETKHLGRGTDFDLMVSNAQTNEDSMASLDLCCRRRPKEDKVQWPKQFFVVIIIAGCYRRHSYGGTREAECVMTKILEKKEDDLQPEKSSFSAAGAPSMRVPEETEWDEFGNDLYAIPEALPVQMSNLVQDAPPTNIADEDSKIKALMDTTAMDWQQQIQDGFGGAGRGYGRGMGGRMMAGRGFGRGIMERKTPPPGYTCHRCKVPGHFIQHCPTNGDPNYDIRRMKPATGIPKSMLVPSADGSYALPSGGVAVLKPNEAAFEKEIDGLPSTRSVTDIPPELRCPLCKEVMQDAVLTSKCCFKSFCDKCIRNHIMSKFACVCGATNVLADDLLPNKTVRETINRLLESNNSSAENAGSMVQVQDMESARPFQPKVASPTISATSKGQEMTAQPARRKAATPTLSAASKGEQLLPTQKDEILDVKDNVSEVKDAGAPTLSLGKGKELKAVDASEATFESMTMKEPMAEEEVQQKASASDAAKKKKKKKARLPPNDVQWRTPQDMAVENYMMPFPPPACDPYWGNMQLGMDGFMNPYGPTMPYMGYVPGPFDVPMGGMLPQDPFGGQGYMMPVVPPQRDLSEFAMGPNLAPSGMSRAEFEARKADLRRKREMERRFERDGGKDQEFGRDLSSGGDVSSLKSKHRMMSSDHQFQRYEHRGEREASLERESSHHHRKEREITPERPRRSHHHRRTTTESPSPIRHVKRRSEQPPRPRDVEQPLRRKRTTEDTAAAAALEADRKQKASVFSRISFPEEKKRKGITSESCSSHDVNSNGYKKKDPTVHNNSANGNKGAQDQDSSDDERHFKRRPSRYEPSPPPPIEWEPSSRSSRHR
ncbi:hypothetical protein IFM89_032526 [Coptis chinensis]|uniref:DWNN domain-containing protein n=1 Tax=Coptis chinensis TaxID=261450 RepID=A0A835MAN2_9MAGN|nr:hypothetical protein IFM89_032526 [Coptis chinensis]